MLSVEKPDSLVIDLGDVLPSLTDPRLHYSNAEPTIRKLLAKGALPIVLGGDHGITTPILRGYDQQEAHLDWRDEVNGVREGSSSPIRRASEMPHIGSIYQIGLRA